MAPRYFDLRVVMHNLKILSLLSDCEGLSKLTSFEVSSYTSYTGDVTVDITILHGS